MARSSSLLFPLALLSWAACNDNATLTRLPQATTQVDELKQRPAAVVDILWVVDNSGSIAPLQKPLADNFNNFIAGLTKSECQMSGMANDVCDFNSKKCSVSGRDCNPPDYHIGVVTTDVHNPLDSGKLRHAGLCVPAMGATPSNNKYRYCEGTNQDCIADATDPASDPANTICDMSHAISFVTPTTPGAPNAFNRIIHVGANGSADEEGIRAGAMALGRDTDRVTGQFNPPPMENSGFVRPDASLFVIFVSDENDSSFGQPTFFYRAFQSLKGAGNEALVSLSAIVGDPPANKDAMGTDPGGCTTSDGKLTTTPGMRYIELAMYSRGLSADFRICDNKRLLCPTGFSCIDPIINLPGTCVPTTCTADQDCSNFKCGTSACGSCQAGQCSIAPQNFKTMLQLNGIYGSMCTPDYGTILNTLGYQAAGLRRKFQLTKGEDCTRQVKCCDDSVPDAMCTTMTFVCVKVNGHPVPNDRATGWVWEASDNAIFFDGTLIPPTASTIAVSYRISPSGGPLSCSMVLK
jgi:hypothetical protein